MLSERGRALDELAEEGTYGYDPRLVRGLKVPVGARILLWVPNIFASPGLPDLYPYIYTVMWRFRNVFDFRQKRLPYHYPKQGEGVPEFLVNAGPRVVIPAATQSVIYNQPEGGAGPTLSFATQNLHSEQIAFGGLAVGNPINPDGSVGAIQQGVLPPSASNSHTRPLYSPHEIQGVGDELLIGVTRAAVDDNTEWAFGDDEFDENFSRFYGRGLDGSGGPFPDIGVYVSCGTAP